MSVIQDIRQGQILFRELVDRAQKDCSFKDLLLSEPERAIQNIFGKEWSLQKGRKIIVEDQSDDQFIYFNIPPEPELENLELSVEELEAVAGGTTWLCITVAAAVIDFGIGFYEGASGKTVNW